LTTFVTDALAAFDCGSNSTRLLIADAEGKALRREMNITRLSEGVDASGALLATAMERTFVVLRAYRRECDEAQVTRGLLVATSAVRDASNGAEFLATARDICGCEARILEGSEEAALSYAGALGDLEETTVPTMIVDVGGGSTELAVEIDGRLVSYSMQMGCVRVTERALGRGIVTPASDAAAREMINAQLAAMFAVQPDFSRAVGAVRLVGLAGTVATLAQLDAGITHYDRDVVHHRILSRATVQHWRDVLARETPDRRLGHPGMVVGREDVLVAGLYILDAVMGRFRVESLISSESDILDGIIATLRR
jgi:exopolyphosphatase / guanosine-5'-triphosphate,3'-diphosphate pyrophosphatase